MPTTTVSCARINNKYIVFNADADLSVYPAEVISKFTFEYDIATTGTLIRVSDMIADYGLRQNAQGGYNPVAYRMAYSASFARVTVKSLETPEGSFKRDDAAGVMPVKDVDALPADVLQAFVTRTDPTQVTEDDVDALGKLRAARAEATPAASD